MSEAIPNSNPDAEPDGFALDVVGVGALNLDYIVNASAVEGHRSSTALSTRVAEICERSGTIVEPGTEALVDEDTMSAVLEAADSGTPPTTVLGGSAFNAIRAIAETQADIRLGFVGVAGRVPVLGMSALRQLDALGVDRRCVLSEEERMCGVCFSYAGEGERTLLTHAGANSLMARYLDEHFDTVVSYLSRARIIHVTSFLDDETAGRLLHVLRAVKEASPATRISFDPGHVWSVGRTAEAEGILELSDYLLVNYREFRELGDRDPGATDEEVASGILRRFRGDRSTVVLKRPSGVFAFRTENGKVTSDFFPQLSMASDDIEDATGAGDVFAAGLLTVLACDRLQVELGSLLGMRLARHKLRYVGSQGTQFARVTREFVASLNARRRTGGLPTGVFIAHGGSPDWLAVKMFIEERLRVPVYSFESSSWAGRQVTEALTSYLERCGFAICVLTAEDLTEDGLRLARQNVVHEIGLFQGRYGFDRVLVLAEDGCDFVPAAAEPHTVRFPHGGVHHTFYQVETEITTKGLRDADVD